MSRIAPPRWPSAAAPAGAAGAAFTAIDGFAPSEGNRVATGASPAEVPAPEGVRRGVYANAAVVAALDPGRTPPEGPDAMPAPLPPGGCLFFALPGGGASVGRFRARVLELCEHLVAEPVFRAPAPCPPGGTCKPPS